jgi:hypothetical protein
MKQVCGAVRFTCAEQEFDELLDQAHHSAIHLSDAKRLQIVQQLEREIFGVTESAQFQYKAALSEKMHKFDEDWVSRKGPAMRSRLEDQFYHFAKPKMHLLSHYKSSIIRMGAPDNFSTDISEL